MLFKDIPGHDSIKKCLRQTVRDGRISHAQLLLGPEGNSKFALAIAYARYINCSNRNDDDACGECPSCVKISSLAHPDIHFIYPVANTKAFPKAVSDDFSGEWREYIIKTNFNPSLNEWYQSIGIEKKQGTINAKDCNNIIHKLSYKHYEAPYKIMLIWMAEKIYYSAAPKILKILEEPPDRTLFLLIAENQDLMLSTILSRTQITKIPRLKNEDLTHYFKSHSEYSDKEIGRAVTIAEGNIKTAERILKQSESDVNNFETFRMWMRQCFQNKVLEVTDTISELSRKNREEQKDFIAYALKITRNSLLINNSNQQLVQLPDEEMDFNTKFSPFINNKNGVEFTRLLEEAYHHIERNANSNILFLNLSLKIMDLLKIK